MTNAPGLQEQVSYVCNICRRKDFQAGPNGRLTNGLMPSCVTCGSLERHRIFRRMFQRIYDGTFKNLDALMFASDQSADPMWFKSFSQSIYRVQNSFDIQNISLPDAALDVVICNHVLEHVLDYKAALKELVRITSDSGFLFLSFPNPHANAETRDWGYPKWEQHGHYRIFGADVEAEMLKVYSPGSFDATALRLVDRDPVTGAEEWAYLISRNRNTVLKFQAKSPRSKLLN